MDMNYLLGKTLTDITVNEANDEILFTVDNGERIKMYHQQDCCENVSIEDINGDLRGLIGNPITMAEAVSNDEFEKNYEAEQSKKEYPEDSYTWTFYKLATVKGYVDIRWFGSSSGYYSEGVSLVLVGSKDDY